MLEICFALVCLVCSTALASLFASRGFGKYLDSKARGARRQLIRETHNNNIALNMKNLLQQKINFIRTTKF